jgi:predicted Ser/Thr protein kinase
MSEPDLSRCDTPWPLSPDESASLPDARSLTPPILPASRVEPVSVSEDGDAPPTRCCDADSASAPALPAAPAHVQSPTPGTLVGDYELLEIIGRGGMGVVYKARQQSLDRVVALKMILPGQLADQSSVERFYEEARSAATLDHPHIVPVYEINRHDGHHYFTMAFVEGTSLRALASKGRLQAPEEVASIVAAVAEALQFAHDKGIIHRDLKPDNVLIDRQGRPRVTDFGLAKRLGGGGPGLTLSGQLLGTPAYMAPEQARGDLAAMGPAADIYGLGGILYFLLTGRPPFSGPNVGEVLYQLMSADPVPPRQLNPAVSPALEAVCLKCLEKDPRHRYPSASALAQAVRAAVPPESVSDTGRLSGVADTTDRTVTTPAVVRRPLRWAVPAAGVVLVALAGAAFLAFRPPTGHAVPPDGSETPPVAVAPEAEAGQPAAVDVAPPSRHDFRVQVEMVGARPGNDGVLGLVAGQEVRFRVTVDRDAYVGLWTFDPQGKATQLFPNDAEPNALVKAGQPRTVPGKDYAIVAEIGSGVEQVRVVASSKPWDLRLGQRDGPFRLFHTRDDLAQLEQQRGLVLKSKAAVAEESLKYRVAASP